MPAAAMTRRWFVRWFAAALALLGASAAHAEPIVTTQLVKNDLMLHEPTTLVVTVENYEDDLDVEVGGSGDDGAYSVRFVTSQESRTASTRVVNGRIVFTSDKREMKFFYEIKPRRSGVLDVGPIRLVRAGSGEVVQSAPPARLVVQEPTERADVKLRVSLSDDDVYVGEVVRLRVEILRSTGSEFTSLELAAESVLEAFEPRRPAEVLSDDTSYGFLGASVRVQRGETDVDGVTFDTFTMSRSLLAAEAGEFELDPIVLIADFRKRGFRRSDRIGVPSDPITVRVRELPSAGRPRDFSGLVGSATVDATAEPTEVEVGAPITFRVTVSSDAALERLAAPELSSAPAWNDGVRVRRTEQKPVYGGGTVTFEYLARLIDGSRNVLPPVELVYFDPDAEGYVTARSEPIDVQVIGGAVATLADADVAPGADAVGRRDGGPAPNAAPLRDAREDLAANRTSADVLRRDGFDVASALGRPVVVVAMAAPPMAYAAGFAAVLMARRRRQRGGVRSVKESAAQALRALASIDDAADRADAIRRALVTYAAARGRGADIASITPQEAVEQIAADAPTHADEARAAARAAEAARYAGAAADAATAERARTMFAALRKDVGRAASEREGEAAA